MVTKTEEDILFFFFIIIVLFSFSTSRSLVSLYNNYSSKKSNPIQFLAIGKNIIRLFLILLISFGLYKIDFFSILFKTVQHFYNINFKSNYLTIDDTSKKDKTIFQINQPPLSKAIKLEEVNNFGYRFYLGEIDRKESTMINDGLKNDITKIIHESKFPKSLLEKTAIYFINSLYIKEDTYLSLPYPKNSIIKMPNLNPEFLYTLGSVSSVYSGGYLILINKDYLKKNDPTNKLLNEIISESVKNNFKNTLIHEFGHIIGFNINLGDWEEYYKLRNIPKETPRRKSVWQLSPEEDLPKFIKIFLLVQRLELIMGF